MPDLWTVHTKSPCGLGMSITAACCCSTIGVRSGKYAQQLTEQGLPHVSNLKGSIVAWVRAPSAMLHSTYSRLLGSGDNFAALLHPLLYLVNKVTACCAYPLSPTPHHHPAQLNSDDMAFSLLLTLQVSRVWCHWCMFVHY